MITRRCLTVFLVLVFALCGCSDDDGVNPQTDPSATVHTPKFVRAWGEQGTTPPALGYPTDLTCDPYGNVYVVDSQCGYMSRMQKFNADSTYVTSWNRQDPELWCLADASATTDRIWALGRDGVTEYDLGGGFKKLWPLWWEVGYKVPTPVGIASIRVVSSRGTGSVSLVPTEFEAGGSGHKLYSVYNITSPTHITDTQAVRKPGFPYWENFTDLTVPGELGDIAIGKSVEFQGEDGWLVYIISDNKVLVYQVAPFIDNTWLHFRGFVGAKLNEWGGIGSKVEFDDPEHVACDAEGNVYVTDRGPGPFHIRIQKFTSGGDLLTSWAPHGCCEGEYSDTDIGGVAVDSQGYVFISDTRHGHIQVFK